MATSSDIASSGARRRTVWTILLKIAAAATAAALATVALAGLDLPGASAPAAATIARTSKGRAYSYGWPVKPFDQPHPVRGNFGDPRTVFADPPTMTGLLHGAVAASFHQGIDVSAPDGTAVYAVASGVVKTVTRGWVQVDSGGGRAFQYWHITATVARGDHVDAGQTVLGHIVRGAEHVHVTELEGGAPVNPLAAGHLGPYSDTTKPTVTAVSFRKSDSSPGLFPNFIRGRVVLVVAAHDTPSLAAPGIWNGLPVSPALLRWRIEAWNRHVVLPQRVAFDHRHTEPSNAAFWGTYARGTFQNMAVFGKHYSWLQPGSYLFRLTPQPFDTRVLTDGVYDLVVTAVDIAGNTGSLRVRFSVHNRAGWIGP